MTGPVAPSHCKRRYLQFQTALGLFGVAWSQTGLTHMQLPEASEAASRQRLERGARAADTDEPAQFATEAVRRLCAYAQGLPADFHDLPIDVSDRGDFEQAVYRRALAIGYGRTATYGDIARDIADIGAARAVGQALGRNPLAIIVPCHRVLASGGKPGGFSAHGGRLTKARLLELEGVVLPGYEPILPGLEHPSHRGRS